MSGGWSDSDRRDFLPPNWRKIRQERLDLDGGRCTWRLPSGKRCPRRATDVDHIGDREDHRIEKLRSLCGHHHGKKSAREGVQARFKKRQGREKRKERHPGAIS